MVWYHIELDLTEKQKDKLRTYCCKHFKHWLCKKSKCEAQNKQEVKNEITNKKEVF